MGNWAKKENSISIYQFIFNHYNNETDNDPSSLAIFEKKLRSISNTIKDHYIKKYILEFFLKKISELTPHLNKQSIRNYKNKSRTIETTKK